MKPLSRVGRPRQTAAPGAAGRIPWCGDRRIVVGTNRRRVSGQHPRSRGSHQLDRSTRRDERQLAPPRERTGVLNRVKVALAALAADATLTRFPRAHRRAFIGASQDTDRSAQRTCARSTGRRSELDSKGPHRSLFAALRPCGLAGLTAPHGASDGHLRDGQHAVSNERRSRMDRRTPWNVGPAHRASRSRLGARRAASAHL